MSVRAIAILTAATAALTASSSFAALITAGQTAYALFENNPVGGTVLATEVQPFATANYTGFLTSTVIQGDTTNTLGGLTFTYQLSNDANSANSLTRLTVNGYAGFATDMSYKLGVGTTAPTTNDRDASNNVVGFTFLGQPVGLGKLDPGTSSELLVVQTNAASYRNIIAAVANGAVSTVNSYAPNGAVSPEPTTIAALGGASILFARRRRA